MATTFAVVNADVRRAYPDITEARVYDLLAEVDDLIRQTVPNCYNLGHGAPVSVALGIGVKEAALAGIYQVHTVQIDGGAQLHWSSIESNTKNKFDWRQAANGSPTGYYLTSSTAGAMMIGVHPTPSVAVTLKVWGTPARSAYPATLGETIPAFIGARQTYTSGALWLASREIRPADEPMRYQMFQEMLKLASAVSTTADESAKGGGEGRNVRA